MIYINKVITSKPMKEIKLERDFEFFKECKRATAIEFD